jgi:LPS-assembly lipoprotein
LKYIRYISLCFILLLTACGFRPLYGSGDTRSNSSIAHLSQIKILSIADKAGHQLHNMLLDRLTPRGQSSKPVYILTSKLAISKGSLGVQRDDTTTRAKLTIITHMALNTTKGQLLDKFTIRSTSGYSLTDTPYATQSAENDAITRSLREISERARLRLATYFSK